MESVAKTDAGKADAIVKSDEFIPEIVAELICSVSKVPRFSIINVVAVIVATGELII